MQNNKLCQLNKKILVLAQPVLVKLQLQKKMPLQAKYHCRGIASMSKITTAGGIVSTVKTTTTGGIITIDKIAAAGQCH